VGFDNTFLLARWDRPLTALTAHRRIEGVERRAHPRSVVESRGRLAVLRPGRRLLRRGARPAGREHRNGDGRTSARYRRGPQRLLPPLIHRGDELRTVAHGGWSEANPADTRREMVDCWGQHWPNEAAASLTRWAASFGADVSVVGLWGAFAAPPELRSVRALRPRNCSPSKRSSMCWHC
jgi:hypothetical protein